MGKKVNPYKGMSYRELLASEERMVAALAAIHTERMKALKAEKKKYGEYHDPLGACGIGCSCRNRKGLNIT